MSWFEQSIMAQKGSAGGKPGRGDTITEAEQVKDHSTDEPFPPPDLTADPDAHLFLTMGDKVRLGTMVVPKYTRASPISKAPVAARHA